MKKRSSFIFTLNAMALIFITLLPTCSKKEAQKETEVITIGIITPLSGEAADLGEEMLQSAKMALEQSNSQYSQQFKLVPRDDQMSAAVASTAVRSLLEQEKTIAILAAGNSPVARGQVQALRGKKIPLISPSATASNLSEGVDYVFRVIPPNSAQGKALVDFAFKLGAKTAAIIFQHDDYSTDLKTAFKDGFQLKGGSISVEVGFEWEETDFRAQLNQIKNSGADVIMCFAQHVQVSRVLVRARELGINQPILSGETAYTDKLLNAAANSAEGFYVTGTPVDLANASPQLKRFIEEYKSKYGKNPGVYGVYSYDAIGLVTSVIANGNPKNGAELIKMLNEVKGYKGITGDIHFNEKGEVLREYKIYIVKNGKFVLYQ